MTLPNYVLGAGVHLYDGTDCAPARIVRQVDATTAVLILDSFEGSTKNGADHSYHALQRPGVTFDANPLAPAKDTFHLAGACPWLR